MVIGDAELEVAGTRGGIESDAGLQELDGLQVLARLVQQLAQVDERVRRARIELRGAPEGARRLVAAPQVVKVDTHLVVRRGEIWLRRDDLLQARETLVMLPLAARAHGPVELAAHRARQPEIGEVHGRAAGPALARIGPDVELDFVDLVLRVHRDQLAQRRPSFEPDHHFVSPFGQAAEAELAGIVGQGLAHGRAVGLQEHDREAARRERRDLARDRAANRIAPHRHRILRSDRNEERKERRHDHDWSLQQNGGAVHRSHTPGIPGAGAAARCRRPRVRGPFGTPRRARTPGSTLPCIPGRGRLPGP